MGDKKGLLEKAKQLLPPTLFLLLNNFPGRKE